MLEESNKEEETMTTDELKEMIYEMLNQGITVEEAIDIKKKDDVLTKESFDICNNTYKAVNTSRKEIIMLLNITKLRLQLYKTISFLLSEGSDQILKDSIDKINETKEYLKNEKELLISIKNSLKELKKYNVSVCNYDINALLTSIFQLNEKSMYDLKEYMQWCSMAINGITYYGNKNYQEEIKQLSLEIEKYTLRLGLNK